MAATDVPFNTRLAANGMWQLALLRSAVGTTEPPETCLAYMKVHHVQTDEAALTRVDEAALARVDAAIAWLGWYPTFLLAWICPPLGRFLVGRVRDAFTNYMLAHIISGTFEATTPFVAVLVYLYAQIDDYERGRCSFPLLVVRVDKARSNMTCMMGVRARPRGAVVMYAL